ncbi:collectin-11-like [Saccostrea cucullata]|uniref:collectin-11-like n=1 Tax=Saccostrea cuccullata TaxID=36930 RepID=UPI002ED1274D
MKILLVVIVALCLENPCYSQAIQCTHGWVGLNTKCYFFSNTKEKYTDASAYCHAFGSKLAEPISQDEVHFISKKVVERGHDSSFYIGVNDLFLEGEWVYAYERTPLKIHPPWINGHADNSHDEDCIEVYSGHQGKWADIPCSTPLYYICEYDYDAEPLNLGRRKTL